MRLLVTMLSALLILCPLTSQAASDTADANAALIRHHHETLAKGDWATASLDFAEDAHNFGHPAGRKVFKRIFGDIYATFPDFRLEILELTTEGDNVIVRCKESGTHQGIGQLPVNGGLLVGVAPTQKHFEVEAVHWYKVRDGKIVDHRGERDDIAMMQQLGLLPPPKPFDWAGFAREANQAP